MVINENLYKYEEGDSAQETKRYFWQPNGEMLTVLFQNESVRIEKIVHFSPSPSYFEYKDNVWLTVIEGNLVIEHGGTELSFERGGNHFIPAGRRFRIANCSQPCITLNVFFR